MLYITYVKCGLYRENSFHHTELYLCFPSPTILVVIGRC